MPPKNPGGASTEKPPLTPELCQAIVVRNAPKPNNFTGPDQPLGKLGVIDGELTKFHKEGIRVDLRHIQYKIDTKTINSGPAVKVSDCSASVQNNAQ